MVNRRTPLVSLLWVLCLAGALPRVWAIDTTPPTIRSVEPASYSILRNNLIRLRADVVDSGSGVDSMYVMFSHHSFEDTTDDLAVAPETIARLGVPPYESVHDFSGVKDFDLFRAALFWVATDRAGNQSVLTSDKIVLDRETDTIPIVVPCARRRGAASASGQLSEQNDDVRAFVNGNNRTLLKATWDRRRFYVSIRVLDSLVISKPDSVGSWIGDCIEIFMDTKHDRSSRRQLDDYQLLIKPHGAIRCLIATSDAGRDDTTWAQLGGVEVDRQTNPDGYSIDVAIPWKTMKMHPRPGLAIGFDIYNTDLDHPDGKRTGYSLAGNERFNNNNPSSWATLRLQAGPMGWLWPTVIGALVALSIACLVLVLRVRTQRPGHSAAPAAFTAAPTVAQVESRLTLDAKAFIRGHLADEDLSVAMVAGALKVNEQYLSRTFNKDAGESFTSFVNSLRVEEAKRLLAQRKLSVSEVAFTVGFGSANNFGKVFKKLTGSTPKLFRNAMPFDSGTKQPESRG